VLEHQAGRRNLTDDQRATIWNDIREQRSKLTRAEQLAKARTVKAEAGSVSAEITDTAKEPKKDTRAAVAKESGVSESKLRRAQKLKAEDPERYKKVAAGKEPLRKKPKKEAVAPAERGFWETLYSKLETQRKSLEAVATMLDKGHPAARTKEDRAIRRSVIYSLRSMASTCHDCRTRIDRESTLKGNPAAELFRILPPEALHTGLHKAWKTAAAHYHPDNRKTGDAEKAKELNSIWEQVEAAHAAQTQKGKVQ
jgi:hypothetical protein